MIDIQRFHEVRRLWHDRFVHALQAHLYGAGLDAGPVENIPEAHPGPKGIAHGTVGPLGAGDAGLKEAA